MPVRNGGAMLVAAVESILAQAESDWEMIFSDNCSEDGTSSYIQDLAARDPRIIYVRHDSPMTAYDNFRYVVSRARGTYFMWAAHDDTRDPSFIAEAARALDADPSAVLAFGDLFITNPENMLGVRKKFDFSTQGKGLVARLIKASGLQCYHIYGLWRTSAARAIPDAYCQWWPDLAVMMAGSCLGPFLYVPGISFYYYEIPKTGLERVVYQDLGSSFNLVHAAYRLFVAAYLATARLKGPMVGWLAVGLIFRKLVREFPGFVRVRLCARIRSRFA
ncbi:MAG: glycosyltransferase family 2 protein [Cyanobacteriota bacterium]